MSCSCEFCAHSAQRSSCFNDLVPVLVDLHMSTCRIRGPNPSAKLCAFVSPSETMSGSWDCICEFISAQSANLQNVMDALGNQHTISDLDVGEPLSMTTGVSPVHLFTFLLMAVWTVLLFSQRQTREGKPTRGPDGGSGSNGDSSGGGHRGAGSSSELF